MSVTPQQCIDKMKEHATLMGAAQTVLDTEELGSHMGRVALASIKVNAAEIGKWADAMFGTINKKAEPEVTPEGPDLDE